MAEIIKPSNQDEILHTLSQPEQEQYELVYASANKVAAKYPDMDTMVYTEYLSDYLENARAFKINTHSSDGAPLDPRFIKGKLQKADNALATEFDKKYPIFAASDASDEEKAIAETNNTALRRLDTEINGGGFIASAVRSVYDEEKGGFQWGSITGGSIGLVLGTMVGSFIAGAAGGGWMGTIVTILLGVTAMMAGSQLGDYLANPKGSEDTKPKATGPSPSQGKGENPELEQGIEKAIEQSNAKIDAALKNAEEKFQEGGMTETERTTYNALKERLDTIKLMRKDNLTEITPAVNKEINHLKTGFAKDGISENEQRALDLLNKNLEAAKTDVMNLPADEVKNKTLSRAYNDSLDTRLKKAEEEYKNGNEKMSKENEASFNTLKNIFEAMKTSEYKHEKSLHDGEKQEKALIKNFKSDGSISTEEGAALKIYRDAVKEAGDTITAPYTPQSETPANKKER
jgi:hypothetical protein